MAKKMTAEKMASVLAKKLTDKEFMRLHELIDSDPPAGPSRLLVAIKESLRKKF